MIAALAGVLGLSPGLGPRLSTPIASAARSTNVRAVINVNDIDVAALVNNASPQQLLLAGSLVLGTVGVISSSGDKSSSTVEQKMYKEKLAMLKKEGAATIARREAIAAGPEEKLVGKVTPVEAVSVEAAFEQADKDGSGAVDMDELKEALEEAGRPADDESVRETMEALDTDNDGVLSLEELRAAPVVKTGNTWWETGSTLQKNGASIGSWW
tara:strand:- start:762 stop:1400 length:639 start_codon:yes stop_codon:yes gene_type:complete